MASFGYTVAGFGAGDVGLREIAVDAIDFNGTTSVVAYANNLFQYIPAQNTDPAEDSTHTISFWLKPETITDADVIVSTDAYGTFPSNDIQLRTAGAGTEQIQFSYIGSNNSNVFFVTSSPGSITTGAWQHIMLTWNDFTPTLYIDGAVDSHTTSGSGTDIPASASDGTHFGQRYADTGGYDYDGCLAEFYIDLNHYNNTESFRSTAGKPVQVPTPLSNYFYLTGDSTTWANQGNGSAGTQTLTSITDCADSPSD